jgi:hypothetical protein
MVKVTSVLLLFNISIAAADYSYVYPTAASFTSSSSKIGYTTIHPGHGAGPVTVTKQYQPVPTYIPAPYSSSTGSWSSYDWVSTIITDYEGKECTVTKTDQPVVIYHSTSMITHYSTQYGHTAPTGYNSSMPAYQTQNVTATPTSTKAYYEFYEKIYEAKYKELGPKALPGYSGSGLWKDKKHQIVKVKEYMNGKWINYTQVLTYDAPVPYVTTYETPGTYTVPAYDVTVDTTTTVPVEATYAASADKPVTYGGVTITVTKATTITVGYGAYETYGTNSKAVVQHKTVACPQAGKYTIIEPITTSYNLDTTVAYPTATTYAPGVYSHTKETITITEPNQPYTCTYHSTEYVTPYPYQTVVSLAYSGNTSNIYTTSTGNVFPTATKNVYSEQPGSPTMTKPHNPDPSSDYDEPAESYGTISSSYVKRGGMLERHSAHGRAVKRRHPGRRVILI